VRISSGDLRERVTIERPGAVADSVGGQTGTWVAVVTNWAASIRPLAARADSETESLSGLSSYSVMMRLASVTKDIDATHRMVWQSKNFRITGATVDRVNGTVQLTAEAGAGVVL